MKGFIKIVAFEISLKDTHLTDENEEREIYATNARLLDQRCVIQNKGALLWKLHIIFQILHLF